MSRGHSVSHSSPLSFLFSCGCYSFTFCGLLSCSLLCDAPLSSYGLLASRLEAMSVSRPQFIQFLQFNSLQFLSCTGGLAYGGDVRFPMRCSFPSNSFQFNSFTHRGAYQRVVTSYSLHDANSRAFTFLCFACDGLRMFLLSWIQVCSGVLLLSVLELSGFCFALISYSTSFWC
jgi:hypothetical protein